LIHLLSHPTAVYVLWHAAMNDANKEAIVRLGGVPLLCRLLRTGNAVLQQQACSTLRNLAHIASGKEAMRAAGSVEALAEALAHGSGNFELQADAAVVLKRLASNNDATKLRIAVNAPCVPVLLRLLGSSPDLDVRRSMAGTLRNLCSNTRCKSVVLEAGGALQLGRQLGSGDAELTEHVGVALSNMAPDSGSNKWEPQDDYLGRGMDALVRLLQLGSREEQQQAAQALEHLTSASQASALLVRRMLVAAGGIPALVQVLGGGSSGSGSGGPICSSGSQLGRPVLPRSLTRRPATEMLVAAAATLAALALDSPQERAAAIQQAGGIPPLLQLLDSSEPRVQQGAAAVLWSLADDGACRSSMLEAGGVAALVRLLGCSDAHAQQAATGTLRKLAASSEEARAVVGRASCWAALVQLLGSAVPGVQEEAAGALNSLCDLRANAQQLDRVGGAAEALEALASSSEAASSSSARQHAAQALAKVRTARGLLLPAVELWDKAWGLVDVLEKLQKVGGASMASGPQQLQLSAACVAWATLTAARWHSLARAACAPCEPASDG
jgi:hypothetical protein